MFTIITKQTTTGTGAGRIVAKANGKQRTVPVDHSKSQGQAQHAVAVGALLDVLADDRQKAMLRHPSGGQRVRVESLSDAGGSYRFTIDV